MHRYQTTFITHDCSNYGAATSLAGLLNCCHDDLETYLVYADQSFRHSYTPEMLRTRFNEIPRKADCILLPFDNDILGKRKVKPQLQDRAKRLVAAWHSRRLAAEIKRCDYCHLNSLGLHRLTWIHPHTIMHVREVYQGPDLRKVRTNLERAAGVIFIDEATAAPFPNLTNTSTIIHNPCDMTDVPEHPLSIELEEKWNMQERTIFAVIGAINAHNKGVDYVLEEYRNADLGTKAVLLVVGSGDSQYIASLKKKYEGNYIIFVGEISDIKAIYGKLDCLLRGDILPAVNRTATEALYTSAYTILPGTIEEYAPYSKFRDRCIFYETRKRGALCEAIKKMTGVKVTERKYFSNLSECRRQYLEFISRICKK